MSLYLEQHGDPSNPRLVLLHGWGMSSDVWQNLLPGLLDRFHLTLIDLPGLARSPAPGFYDLDTVLARLVSAVDAPASWLGWSLGGQLAIALADRYPERVQKLVTVASSPCFVARNDWGCAMAEPVFSEFEQSLQQEPAKTLQRFMMLQTQGALAGRETLKFLRQLQKSLEHTALMASLQLLRRDEREQLASLTMPVLQVFGEKDQLVPAAVAAACTRLTGQPVAVYPEAGHLPFYSHPERFIADLTAFLEPHT